MVVDLKLHSTAGSVRILSLLIMIKTVCLTGPADA